jgi:hypothetical protein
MRHLVFFVDVPIQRRRVAVGSAAKIAQKPWLPSRRWVGDSFMLHQGELARKVLVAGIAGEPVQHCQLEMF